MIGLLAQIIGGASRLLSGEIALFKAEAAKAAKDTVRGVVLLIVGAVLALFALIWLLQGLREVLVHLGLGPIWSAFAVAGLLVLAAVICLVLGAKMVRRGPEVPKRGFARLKRDFAALADLPRQPVAPGDDLEGDEADDRSER